MSTPVENFLHRLKSVRASGPGRWMARCPAHEDKSPSLTIKSFDDDAVGIYCFAGCKAADIVRAVGLELSDLFPKKLDDDFRQAGARRRKSFPVPVYELLSYMREDLMVVMMTTAAIAAGTPLKHKDYLRLDQTALRLYEILETLS